jgi:hypothetical protein
MEVKGSFELPQVPWANIDAVFLNKGQQMGEACEVIRFQGLSEELLLNLSVNSAEGFVRLRWGKFLNELVSIFAIVCEHCILKQEWLCGRVLRSLILVEEIDYVLQLSNKFLPLRFVFCLLEMAE